MIFDLNRPAAVITNYYQPWKFRHGGTSTERGTGWFKPRKSLSICYL
jgi:hypothetical protein